jgi:hypothetical protein
MAYSLSMHALAALLFFLAQPFWEAKAPAQWTDAEIQTLLRNGPWAQTVGPSPELAIWFATAEPVEAALAQAQLRSAKPKPDPDVDYLDFLQENRDKVFVLAVGYPSLHGLGKEADAWTTVERETLMMVGGKKYHIEGTFPPTPSDPVLRLVFPRAVKPTDKRIEFQLYIPGVPFPDRQVSFDVRDLIYHGKLAL